jgi:hypothetical protein
MKQSHPAIPDREMTSASLQILSGIPEALEECLNHRRESVSQIESSSETHGVFCQKSTQRSPNLNSNSE